MEQNKNDVYFNKKKQLVRGSIKNFKTHFYDLCTMNC